MEIEKKSLTLFESFQKAYQNYPQKEIVYFKKDNNYTTLTYEDLYQKAKEISYLLLKKGIQKNDRIALILDNAPDWIAAFFGILRLGAIVVPLNPEEEIEEIKCSLEHSQSKLILTSSALSFRFKKLGREENSIIALDKEKFSPNHPSRSQQEIPPTIHTDDLAVIAYTSGTISSPKGVMLTHKNLLSQITALKKINLINSDDCIIALLPFYHIYPLMVTLLFPLLTGVKISIPSPLNFAEIRNCINQTGVTIFIGVPKLFSLFYEAINRNLGELSFLKKFFLSISLTLGTVLRKMFSINLARIILKNLHKNLGGKIRFMVSGGAKLNPEIALAFYKWGFTLLEGYGLTEASSVVSFNLPKKCKIGSAGKPIPGVEIKIHQPDETGVGEILIKGDNVFSGYWQQDKLTREAIKNTWFYSGDLGYLDKEGFLWITGRKKELIVLASGKKINPEDLESYYKRSPFLDELCIFLSHPPKEKDLLTAVIRPNYDYFARKGVSQIKDKIRWEIENISHSLPPYKRIQKYILTKDPLPKTILGKLKRKEVEKKYTFIAGEKKTQTEDFPEDEELYTSELCQKALNYLSRKLNRKVSLDDNLELDLGLDSLEQIALVLEFQQITGIEIADEDLFGIFTVRDVLNKLSSISSGISTKAQGKNWQEILKIPLSPEIKKSFPIHLSLLSRISNLLFFILLKVIAKLFFRLKIQGRENFPEQGPYILCPNHTSFLDGPLLAASLNFSSFIRTYYLGYSTYLNHPLLAWAQKPYRLIPVDPAKDLTETLRICHYILNNRKVLCLFPEGVRSLDGTVREFKRGAGIFIKELNVPAIPVYIKGTYECWPRTRKLPRPGKVTIYFGKKLTLQDLTRKSNEKLDIYANIVHNLRTEVINLSKRNLE